MANKQLMSTLITKPEAQKKPQDQLKAQTKTQITPVQSNLPSMQQAGVASASQVSAATKDLDFTKAITDKYTQDVERQKKELKKQQAQQPTPQPQSGVGRQRIAELLNKINTSNSDQEVAAATSEYQQLMAKQTSAVEESAESKAARANLAALSRLSGGAQLASAYGVGPVTGTTAAGLQPNGALSSALMDSKKATLEAERAAAISDQELQLEKNRLAQMQAFGGVAAAGEQSKFLRELSGRAKDETDKKDVALKRIKEGIFLGKTVSQADLDLLGITPAQASEMISFDLEEIEGLVREEGKTTPTDLEGLETAVQNLRSNIPQDQMTQEQKDLINYYDRIQSEFTRNADLTSEYAFATPEQKARINALRRLTGQSEISEDAIGGGKESGKVELPSVFKDISQSEKTRMELAAQEALSPESERLYLEQSRTINRPDNIKELVDGFGQFYRSTGYLSGNQIYKYLTRYSTFDKAAASHMENVFNDTLKSTESRKQALQAVQRILATELKRAREAAKKLKEDIDYRNKTTAGFTRGLNISENEGGA